MGSCAELFVHRSGGHVTVDELTVNDRIADSDRISIEEVRRRAEHVVVLMLENRSFDHMLGFLDHPDGSFERLVVDDERFSNRYGDGSAEWLHFASPIARTVVPVDPDHSHAAAMLQLGVRPPGPPNGGFVASYAAKAVTAMEQQQADFDLPGLVMACQPTSNVPALSTLAREFAVCIRWFSSVPGETWPNRNFVHASTSDQQADNEFGIYTDRTIFELLADPSPHRSPETSPWRIYHDGPTHVMCFRKLWTDGNIGNWSPMDDFASDVANDRLAGYSFIEPNHHSPLARRLNPRSSSQHPGNNLVGIGDYLDADADAGEDFRRGDQLIAEVYEALRANPAVFDKTVLLITYDEHGGFYDHQVPPATVAPGDPLDRGWLRSIVGHFVRQHRGTTPPFGFDRLGVRVPTVVVSPWIERGRIDRAIHDHSSVPRTLRELFMPHAAPLTRRETAHEPFWPLLDGLDARRGSGLPSLADQLPATSEWALTAQPASYLPDDAYGRALVAVARYIGEALDQTGDGARLSAEEYMEPGGTEAADLLSEARSAMDRFADLAAQTDATTAERWT